MICLDRHIWHCALDMICEHIKIIIPLSMIFQEVLEGFKLNS